MGLRSDLYVLEKDRIFRDGVVRSPISMSIELSRLLDAWITDAYILLFCGMQTCPEYSCSKLLFDELGEMRK
jgi:hypothetical protein